MPTGTCHCGAVRIEIPRKPVRLTSCNCSICRRYGTLWGYFKAATVQVYASPSVLQGYSWGDMRLRFVRCGRCGCVMHWERVQRAPDSRMGVNARNFEPDLLANVRIRRLDGASSWKFLD